MNFIETALPGAYIVKLNPLTDERGMFVRTFCKREFDAVNLVSEFVQCNASRSKLKGTLRGMHFQTDGSEEVKLIRCVRGTIQDVIVDLRPGSNSYCNYTSVILSEAGDEMLYVPAGFAHGFLTLENDCEITYMVSNFYSPTNERGVRWNDPAFKIKWNIEPSVISEKDARHADYQKISR